MSEKQESATRMLLRAPEGFTLLKGMEGGLFLACGEELAESYAVHVVTDGPFATLRTTIAKRVPKEAAAVMAGVGAGAVVWNLGVIGGGAAPRQIVVHRPFGAILEF